MCFLRSNKIRCRGFTLVELLTAIVTVTIISVAVISTFLAGRRTWFISSTLVTVQQEVRRAVERMVRELTFSAPMQSSIGASQDSITFQAPESVDADGNITWSNSIQYSVNAGQILRTSNGQTSVLANDISNLQFLPLGSRGIEIRITAQKYTVDRRNIQYSLSTQLQMRNE